MTREPGRTPPRHAHGDLTSLAPNPSDGFLTRLTSLTGLLQLCIRLCTVSQPRDASASSESRLAGQWLRFKVFAARKHCTRHTGLGAKCCTEVTTATLRATTTAQLSTAMGSGAPGDARPANPTEFRDGDMILQLPADRCHPCTQTHCYCLGLHGTGPCC